MKEDLGPLPPHPPRKRRQLEQAPPVWLAMWAESDTISPSERRRVQAERERRKYEHRPVIIVCLVAREGLTPPQRTEVYTLTTNADELRQWRSGNGETYQEVVKEATLVIAAPKERTKPVRPPEGSVWEALRYARHRGLPVKVIMPDGQLLGDNEK